MEYVDIILMFLSWVWSWLWKISVVVSVLFFMATCAIQHALNKKIRTYIPNPTHWLSVMSSERWSTIKELAQHMNTKHNCSIFKVHGTTFGYTHVPAPTLVSIFEDMDYLVEHGFVERRVVYSPENGNEPMSTHNFNSPGRSELGIVHRYGSRWCSEYKKTPRGSTISSRNVRVELNEFQPVSGEFCGMRI